MDSVNRVYRVQRELTDFANQGGRGQASVMGSERSEVQARKFYSQRNMYVPCLLRLPTRRLMQYPGTFADSLFFSR